MLPLDGREMYFSTTQIIKKFEITGDGYKKPLVMALFYEKTF
jgi:hypothetical protein